MAVTTKKTFNAVGSGGQGTTVFTPVSIELNNQDDLDVYVTKTSAGISANNNLRIKHYRQNSTSNLDANHDQVNDTTGLYFPALTHTGGTETLQNYTLSADNNTITFNSALPTGAVVSVERRTRDSSSDYTNFAGGSTIRSTQLNDAFDESNFTAQEARNKAFELEGKIFGTEATSTSFITSDEIVDGTIATADIANNAINADKIADNAVTASELADNAVDRNAIVNDAVNGTKIADDSIDSEHYVDASIDLQHLASNSVNSSKIVDGSIVADDIANTTITGAKLVNDTVTATQIAANAITASELADNAVDRASIVNDAVDGSKIADNSIDSEHYVDGSIDVEHLADNSVDRASIVNDAVDGSKIADDAINSEHYVDGSIDHVHLANDIIDGDNIVANAVGNEHIVANAVGTSEIAADAVTNTQLADDAVTGAKIHSNTITSDNIQNGTIGHGDLANDCVRTENILNGTITHEDLANDIIDGDNIQDNAIGAEHIAANAVTTSEIADAELTTLAGMQSGTASLLAGSTALTSTLTELNLLDGKSVVTTVSGSSSDVQLPTAKAVNDQILAVTNALGGFVAIADKDNFPTSNPDPSDNAGTVVSIADAVGISVNSSGVGSLATRAGGSSAVIINGFPSALRGGVGGNANPNVLSAGQGLQVQTTSTAHTYDYHKLVYDEGKVATIQAAVDDFDDRYYGGVGSNPSTKPSGGNRTDGDLYFNTSTNKMKVFNGTHGSGTWDDVATPGDFYINTISSYSGTGGNNATFNGTAYRFVLSNPPTSAQQLVVSVNGVIQKPNAGTSQPSEGFAINGSSILFSSPPANGADYFIITIGSSVNIGTPSDNTVSTAKIQNLAVDTAQLAADAVEGSKIADDAVGAEHIEDLDATVKFLDNVPAVFGTGNDTFIRHIAGSHTEIDHVGSGDLVLETVNGGDDILLNSNDDVFIQHAGEDMAVFRNDGVVELYYDNAKKLETTANGVLVTGYLKAQTSSTTDSVLKLTDVGVADYDFTFPDTSTLKLGTSTSSTKQLELRNAGSGHFDLLLADNGKIKLGDSNDLQIYHTDTGNKSHITHSGAGALEIYSSGDNTLIKSDEDVYLMVNGTENGVYAQKNGKVGLYYDNSTKLETTSGGISVTGTVDSDGLSLGDGQYLDIGGGNDLRIYHSGDDSVISKTTAGNLLIYVNEDFYLKHGTEKMIAAKDDGAVELYYNDSKKFETTSTGGHITSGANATSKLHIGHQATRGLDIRIANTGGQVDSTCILDAKDSESSNYHAQIQFHLGASEKARFEGNGNYFRMASGTGGIQFGGDSAAAQALDDYDEGTFTPEISSGLSGGTISYNSRSGRYTKIGNVVTFTFHMNIASCSLDSGHLKFGGLPATSVNNGHICGGCYLIMSNGNMGTDKTYRVEANSTVIEVITAAGDAFAANSSSLNAGNRALAIHGSYYAA